MAGHRTERRETLKIWPEPDDNEQVITTLSEVETTDALAAGIAVRLEADGRSIAGRVVSVGEAIRIAIDGGPGELRRLSELDSLSLQFGGHGILYVADTSVLACEDPRTVWVSRPAGYSVWRRLLQPCFEVLVPVTAVIGGKHPLTVHGETVDLSTGGTSCLLPDVGLEAGSVLELTLHLPGGDVTTTAVVMAAGTVHRLRFVGLDKTDFLRLVEFCKPERTWDHTTVLDPL